MHLNRILDATLATGGRCKIGSYDCRGSKHYAFRILPTGEIPERLGRGRYRWQDFRTGQWFETLSPLAVLRNELADLRITGAASSVKPRKYGPDKLDPKKSEWFKNGREVQRLIDAGIKQSEARHSIAASTRREYSSIEQYHKRYRSFIAENPE